MFRVVVLLILTAVLTAGTAPAIDECADVTCDGNPFPCCYWTDDGDNLEGNCTWWAYCCRPDLYPTCSRYAMYWLEDAIVGSVPTGTDPVVGAIAFFNSASMPPYGHVAYVTAVNEDDTFSVSEMGCESWMGIRYHSYGNDAADGFIYGGQAGGGLTYGGTYVSQTPTDPSGILHLQPNETVNCSFTFRNTGTAYWTNDGGSSHYVELHAVNSTWTQDQASSLAYGWISGSQVRITTTTGRVDPPTGTGLYSFQIHTPITPGSYSLRVALYHPHSSQFISGTGPKIEIEVVNPPPPPPPNPPFTPALRLDVNGGGGASDLLIADLAYSNVWAAICDGSGSFNPQPLQCQGMSPTGVSQYLSGDVDGDTKVDAIAVDRYAGNIRVAKSNGWNVTSPSLWRTGWQGGSVCQFFPGYCNDNPFCDIVSYYPPAGAFYVVFSNTVNAFTDATGPYAYGAWLTGWAVQPLGSEQYEIAVGDVNGDKRTDLIAFEQSPGNVYVALNTGQNSFAPQTVWLSNFCYGSTWDLFMADVTGDGKDDCVFFHEASGAWQVAGSTGTSFVQCGGLPPYGNWITGWGSYLTTPIFGKFTGGDAKFDMALHEYVTGTVQMVRSTGGSFEYVPGSGPSGTWIQNFCTAGWDPGRMVTLRYGPDAPDSVSSFSEQPTRLLLTPNPASSTLQLAFPGGAQFAGERQVWIADATGREVLSTRIPGTAASWRLDLSNLATGIYFVRLAGPAAGRTTQKLIVLR